MTTSFAPPLLGEYGARVRAALAHYFPERPDHFIDELVADYPKRGGKMIRPSLLIATARAFGGAMERALGAAVAVEMLHNAMLIHDDIQDGGEQRRGSAALHAKHGIPLAVSAGDALAMRSIMAVVDGRRLLGSRLTMEVLRETERMSRESAEGQALELGWRQDNVTDLSEADYLLMVLKKTSWLAFIYPCRAGALIGGASLVPSSFVRFGFFLGAAFQIQDDILNLVGEPAKYGKEIAGDLQEGKRSLMVIRLLRLANAAERERIVAMLGRSDRQGDDGEVVWLRARIEAHGCLEYAQRMAYSLAGAAQHEFDVLFGDLPPSPDKQLIADLVAWVSRRAC